MKKKYFIKMLNRAFKKNNGIAIDYIDKGFKQGIFIIRSDDFICHREDFLVNSSKISAVIPYKNIKGVTTIKM